MTAEELFWDLVEPMYADPAVQRSTMMGLPCVRLAGRFFASLERRSGALLVKLPPERVGELIAAGHGEAFAPAGRVFREWVAIPRADRRRWSGLLTEARDYAVSHAASSGTSTDVATVASRADTVAFGGFGTAGLTFLAGLEQDNSRRYFDAHRAVYRRELLEPSKAFVVALGQQLRQRVSAGLRAEPRIGGSLFRIANDLRFDQSKPPYKPHLDFAFWEGPDGPRVDPSLILRITPTQIHFGCGMMPLTGPALDRYRAALRDAESTAALDQLVAAVLASGGELSEPTRRRLPAGFDPTGPAARFALRDGFHLTHRYPTPAAISSPRLLKWCADRLVAFGPVHLWLTRYVTQNAAGGRATAGWAKRPGPAMRIGGPATAGPRGRRRPAGLASPAGPR